MRPLEKVEARLHWLAVPGLFKWLTLLGVVVWAWQFIDPKVGSYIAFDRGKLLAGEFWRLFTFAFAPAGVFGPHPLGALFLYFAVRIAFLVSDSLEEVWGETRTTLYLIVGWLGLAAGQFLLGLPSSGGGYLYSSMFFAFATYFPRYTFHLFLFLPVQVRILGWIGFALLLLSVVGFPPNLLVVLPTLIPYGIWVLPSFLRERKTLAESARRRRKFQHASEPEEEAFHRCVVCGRTEKSDPDLDFRTLADGTEYCIDHLPAQEG